MKSHSIALVVSALLVGACTGSSAEPEVTAPVPTAAPTRPTTSAGDESSTSTSADSTSSSPTTQPPSTVATTDPPPAATEAVPTTEAGDGGTLSDDLGEVIDSAPGVNSPGEIIELLDMVVLFLPSELDPDDANVVPPLPEDIEIIEAYAQAMTALYGQVTQNPIPVEPSEEMAAAFLDGGETYSENVFGPRNAAGQHLAFQGDNDVLRPTVLADPRSDEEAFIFDCAISGSNYVNADGSLADGEVDGSEEAPLIIRLVRVDGRWIVTDIQDDERACR